MNIFVRVLQFISVLKMNQENILFKIRTLRQQKGYSQEYMATLLEMKQSDYNKLENGKTELTVNKVASIAKILEVIPNELIVR